MVPWSMQYLVNAIPSTLVNASKFIVWFLSCSQRYSPGTNLLFFPATSRTTISSPGGPVHHPVHSSRLTNVASFLIRAQGDSRLKMTTYFLVHLVLHPWLSSHRARSIVIFVAPVTTNQVHWLLLHYTHLLSRCLALRYWLPWETP